MGKKAAPVPTPPPPEEEEKVKDEDPGEVKEGDFIFPDGATYSGAFLKKGDDVCLHGNGTLTSGPEVFQGTFEKGLYKEGTFKSCNGSVYVGHFHENKFHGLGEYTWDAKTPEQRTYYGMWKNGYMHGSGEYHNFSFGVHKSFKGFSFRGRFSSAREEQEQLKSSFLSEYAGDYAKSAGAALREMAEKATPEVPEKFLVPPPAEEGADETPEKAAEIAAVEELVVGPFPAASSIQAAALQAFSAKLDEGALKVSVLEEMEQCQFAGGRLRHEQLQHVGQAVEMVAPDAEAGAIKAVVLLNVSSAFDIAGARWKLVHVEVPEAA